MRGPLSAVLTRDGQAQFLQVLLHQPQCVVELVPHFTLNAPRMHCTWYPLVSNTMSLSWFQAGTRVFYIRDSVNERVHATVMG